VRLPHWSLAGPHKVSRPELLLRHRNVGGPAHVAVVRRLLRIGPWSIMVLRYRPGHLEE
jgi:hypothetical protein